jgi:hypothetical protein
MADMGHVPVRMDAVAQNDFPVAQKTGRYAHLTGTDAGQMRKTLHREVESFNYFAMLWHLSLTRKDS